MPGGTFAGPYNNSTWVDPSDSTILGSNALGADLVNSPVTISFWLKINQVDQPFINTAPAICTFGRWMYQPHHNAGNSRGISIYGSRYAAGYNDAPTMYFNYGTFNFRYVLAGVNGSAGNANRWGNWKARDNSPFDGFIDFLVYFTPGEAGNDTSKFNMYFNNDDTRGTVSGATPTTAGVYGGTSSSVVSNAFSNPYYYLPGDRTILGGTSDSNGGNSDANKGYEIKQLVLYNKVVSDTERNTIYNSGTPLASKDLYPTGALAGYFFEGSTTYEADFYNAQQGETGRWKSKNVFGSPKGDVTSNYYRSTSDNALYAKMGNYPSPLLKQSSVGHSN